MISRILAAELSHHLGATVKVAGWLHRRRDLKSVTFLIVRDRSGFAQVVLNSSLSMVDIPEETVIEVSGVVVANEQAPGGVEITQPAVTVLSDPAVSPPFDLYRPVVHATLPTVLNHASVALRHPMLRAPFVISAASTTGFRTTLNQLGFTEVHTPKIVGTATESGATVFGIDYFGQQAYLAQSPQFYKQALVGIFERVYEVGPVFRAEPHDTTRHLAQYTSLDVELGFIQDYHDVMNVLRDVLSGMLEAVAARTDPELTLLNVELPSVPGTIPEIHFTDAQELLAKHTGEDPRGDRPRTSTRTLVI